MMLKYLRNPYNYDTREASVKSALYCLDPSRARQEFKEECDINTIVEDFGITGQVPIGTKAPEYQDFEGVLDFQTAINAVMEAEESFGAMPAAVRREFDNDPQKFLEFCADERNLPRLREWGLAHSKIEAKVEPIPVIMVQEPPKAP